MPQDWPWTVAGNVLGTVIAALVLVILVDAARRAAPHVERHERMLGAVGVTTTVVAAGLLFLPRVEASPVLTGVLLTFSGLGTLLVAGRALAKLLRGLPSSRQEGG